MSTATQPECDTEHEILSYIRAQKHINSIVEGTPMKMMMKTPLAKALDAMSRTPLVQTSFEVTEDSANSFTIAGVEAGTLYNPKVDLILEKSTPSSFGKGSETVLDSSYRNGREIQGESIKLKGFIAEKVWDDLKKFLFPGREVDYMKPYKLAVYEAGGHFDWHMDSTHSDQHHATLLVALNTSWEGGGLVFRGSGIDSETHVDLRPQTRTPGSVELQAVAFFTDTEHCVEPVKSGTRIVLQFDVGLEEEEPERGGSLAWLDPLGLHYSERMKIGAEEQATTDKTALDKVLAIIKELHNDGTEEVALALQHIYRKSSILSQYLKGSDATLYDALKASGEFDVSLLPVIFQEASEEEGYMTDHYAYRCDDSQLDDSQSDDSRFHTPASKKQKRDTPEFHIPELSGIIGISKQDYVEYTGNNAMAAEYRYFGGGMFIRPKSDSSTNRIIIRSCKQYLITGESVPSSYHIKSV